MTVGTLCSSTLIRPAIVGIIAASITGVLIYSIGHLLLHFADHSITDELQRKEPLDRSDPHGRNPGGRGTLATRPAGALGPLDKPVAIGKTPMAGELSLAPVPLERQAT
ncbi:MAG: hypothetical protein R2848_04685 [Thermomicrobiales bacterium]